MIEIRSDKKLPIIFKDLKSGYIDGNQFINGNFRQSLTNEQIAYLSKFAVVKKVAVKQEPVEVKKEVVKKVEKKETELKVVSKKNKGKKQ